MKCPRNHDSRAGAKFCEQYGDRPGEHYEVLAYHFSRAEHWDKAL